MPGRRRPARLNVGLFDGVDIYDVPPTPPPKDPNYIPKTRINVTVTHHPTARSTHISRSNSRTRPPISRYSSYNGGDGTPGTPGVRRQPSSTIIRPGGDIPDLPTTPHARRYTAGPPSPSRPRSRSRRGREGRRKSRAAASPTSPYFPPMPEPSAAIAASFSEAITAGTLALKLTKLQAEGYGSRESPLKADPETSNFGEHPIKSPVTVAAMGYTNEVRSPAAEVAHAVAIAFSDIQEAPVEASEKPANATAEDVEKAAQPPVMNSSVREGESTSEVADASDEIDEISVKTTDSGTSADFDLPIESNVEPSPELLPMKADVEDDEDVEDVEDVQDVEDVDDVDDVDDVEDVEDVDDVEDVEGVAAVEAFETPVESPAENTDTTVEPTLEPVEPNQPIEICVVTETIVETSPQVAAVAKLAAATQEDDSGDSDESSACSSLLQGPEGGKSTRSSSLTIGDYIKSQDLSPTVGDVDSVHSASDTAGSCNEEVTALPRYFCLRSRRSSCSSLPDKALDTWAGPVAVPMFPATAALHRNDGTAGSDSNTDVAPPPHIRSVPGTGNVHILNQPAALQKSKRMTKSTPHLRVDSAASRAFSSDASSKTPRTARLPSIPNLFKLSRNLLSPPPIPQAPTPPALKRISMHKHTTSTTSNSSMQSTSRFPGNPSPFSGSTLAPAYSYSVTCTSDGRPPSQSHMPRRKSIRSSGAAARSTYTPGLKPWDEAAFQKWEVQDAAETSVRKSSGGSLGGFLRRGRSMRKDSQDKEAERKASVTSPPPGHTRTSSIVSALPPVLPPPEPRLSKIVVELGLELESDKQKRERTSEERAAERGAAKLRKGATSKQSMRTGSRAGSRLGGRSGSRLGFA